MYFEIYRGSIAKDKKGQTAVSWFSERWPSPPNPNSLTSDLVINF